MNLDVTRLELGPIGTNCYLVRRPGADEAVVVDPGDDAAAIRLELASRGARCVAILVTHGHWDHAGAMLLALTMIRTRNDGREQPVHYWEAAYDRQRTQKGEGP
jgi:glyoxylase-like metal-dependent hydrolase (beta-lactamase superfamily II)